MQFSVADRVYKETGMPPEVAFNIFQMWQAVNSRYCRFDGVSVARLEWAGSLDEAGYLPFVMRYATFSDVGGTGYGWYCPCHIPSPIVTEGGKLVSPDGTIGWFYPF